MNSEKLKNQIPFPTKSSSRCLGTTAFPVAVINHKKSSRFTKQDYLKNESCTIFPKFSFSMNT